jgi:hypothetical protein
MHRRLSIFFVIATLIGCTHFRPAMSPESLVQEQLDAYNARDLQRFVATYAQDIKIYGPPNLTLSLEGKQALSDSYAELFKRPNLHARLLNRMVLGNKVIDHEHVEGLRDTPVQAVAVYEVKENLISTVWFFSGR